MGFPLVFFLPHILFAFFRKRCYTDVYESQFSLPERMGIVMKILASDFDGTFHMGEDFIPQNITAVKRWQKAGNQFGIVTGRPYHMILPELKKYHIPVDFLVCVNGAAIHEPEGNLLWAASLPDEVSREILSFPELDDMPLYLAATREGIAIHIHQSGDPFWDKAWPYVCNLGRLEPEEMRSLTGVIQISTVSPDSPEAHRFAAMMSKRYPGITASHVNRNYVDTTAFQANKGQGIRMLAEKKGWNPDEIYTIGDGNNDLPMLTAFHGAAPVSAEKEVLAAVSKTVTSVADYIEQLLA